MGLTVYIAFLLATGAERLAELFLSRRNARLAFARGAIEAGRDHFPFMVGLHTALLPACAIEALWRGQPWLVFILPALAAQALRWWAIATLGARWNVRVIVVPGEPLVQAGPYRFLRHPNYLAVALEMIFIPLAGGAWICAILFSFLNVFILRVRIREEERALGYAHG
jgi:methyltransferase